MELIVELNKLDANSRNVKTCYWCWLRAIKNKLPLFMF